MAYPKFLSFGSIDGYDFLTQLGIAVSKGADSFKQPHSVKEGFSYDWPGQDGIEFDLEAPIIKQARTFSITGWLLASSEPEFNTKYNQLYTILYQPGYRVIHVNEYNIKVACRLRSFPSWERPKGIRVKNSTDIGIEIALEFIEVMGVVIPEPTSDIWLGSFSRLLVTAEDITENLNSVAWTTTPELPTGTVNRFFHLVVPEGVSVLSVTNVGALFPDITGLYLEQSATIEVAGEDKDIYTMELALPYSTNRTHLFELSV